MPKNIIIKKFLICILIVCFLTAYVSCGKENKYDIKADSVEEYLWDNCFKDVLNSEIISCSNYHEDPYIWFTCYLSSDRTFNEVKPLLEELQTKVLNKCADKTFEPYNTFLTNQYYSIYVELINPQKNRQSEYPRRAGLLRILTKEFPIDNIETQTAVIYY